MYLLHFSDTHLGYSEYHKIDPVTGLNQREQDVYNAWEQVIENILQIHPDVVLHTGDLFHTPRPSNRAIRIALEGIQRISDAGIPLVIISGNHETPRIKSTGSIFESIALFPHVYAAYTSEYKRFRIGECDFHCVPHCSLSEELEAAFEAVETDDAKYNVFLSHGAWTGKLDYSMGEFNEQRIPDVAQALNIEFDYVALGHYHKHLDINDTVSYCGSTERTSFNEAGNTCGYLLVRLDEKTREYNEIVSRAMYKPRPVDCRDMSAAEIYKHLEGMNSTDMDDAMLSLVLENIDEHTFLKLDSKEIDTIFKNTFYLQKSVQRVTANNEKRLQDSHIDSLPVEFSRYLENVSNAELNKEKLLELGNHYLTQYI